MSIGSFTNKNGVVVSYGFFGVEDWLDSIISSFPAPWLIGDNTHYGTEIFDARGVKIMSIWMAWGNPSERQRGGMSEPEWVEYCCDTHWESETQWHIANAVVATRNYLKAHSDRGWDGDDESQRGILRNLVMSYGRWEAEIDEEICCGGPDRRMTSTEAEKYVPQLKSSSYGDVLRQKTKEEMSIRAKSTKPSAGTNPEALESQLRKSATLRAMDRMFREYPPQSLELANGLKVDAFTMMDGSYFEGLAEKSSEEYDKLKRRVEPPNGR